MKIDRMLFLAALLCFAAAWGVYELGLGSRLPVMAATQNGPVAVPEEHMRDCLRQRVLTLFGDEQAHYYWRSCEAHFARYRALGALELRINTLLAFSLLGLALAGGLGLGVAYGVWAATGVALTAVGSRLLFDEPLTPLMGAGLALIIVGVLLVELGVHAG